MNLLDLGKKIKQLRLQLGITQNQLAGKISVSYQQIQKYEKGTSHMTVSRFVTLARALEAAPQKLLESAISSKSAEPDVRYHTDKSVSLKATPEEKKLVGYFRTISDKNLKKCVLKLMKSVAEDR